MVYDSSSPSASAWLVGVARADITPEPGLDLAGGAFGPARSVIHPLSAKALFLKSPEGAVLVVSCDLLGFDPAHADRLREAMGRAAGIPAEAVMLAATHTHGAPATFFLRTWGRQDDSYLARLDQVLPELAAEAARNPQPATLRAGWGQAPGLVVNRDLGPDGPLEEAVGIVEADGPDGKPLALAVLAACHPVNLHSSGGYTPDFPHELEAQLRTALGTDLDILFLLGACGDLLPANFKAQTPNPEAAAETGQKLAEAVLAARPGLCPVAAGPVRAERWDVSLALAELPSDADLEAEARTHRDWLAGHPDGGPADWETCKHASLLGWAEDALAARKELRVERQRPAPIQGLRLGDLALIGVPGELFCAYPGQARKAGILPVSMVVTQANGSLGYFPTAGAFERNRYEAVHAPKHLGTYLYKPDVGDRIRDGILDTLRILRHGEANPKNRALWQRACAVVVGGGQGHKRPQPYLVKGGPAFAARARGARFWDVDGREYTDYLLAYGPIVLGHADPAVNEAIRAQIVDGTLYTVEHPSSIELAEELCRRIPCAERVLYFIGGSSATQGALRCARTHTGREKIVRCGYHGWFDWCWPAMPGVPRHERELILDIPYNDLPALETVLESHRGEVAGVIVESVQGDGPSPGYFDGLRDLVHRHGALFILDEVKTGFRFDLGGAQRRFGIDPDLAVFGKAMANGYPGSVVVGREHILRDRTDTYLAATFHADALSCVAALTVIRELERRDGIAHFERMGRRLIDGLNQVFEEAKFPAVVGGFPAMPVIDDTRPDHPTRPVPAGWEGKAFREFCAAMQRRGQYITGHVWFLSLAHTESVIDATIATAREAIPEAVEILKPWGDP